MTLIVRTGERGVATLTLDSPANRNALSAALVGELRERSRGAPRTTPYGRWC
ncbi:hypothetical protein SMICM304S_00788 [Streptomyces microflavus]